MAEILHELICIIFILVSQKVSCISGCAGFQPIWWIEPVLVVLVRYYFSTTVTSISKSTSASASPRNTHSIITISAFTVYIVGVLKFL